MRLLPFDYAVRNLGRSKVRLVLTVVGGALLVLIVLTAAAFVRGMDRSMRGTGGEHNVILLGVGSEESVERSEVGSGVAGIVAASVRGIREHSGVSFVSPEVHVQLPVAVEPDSDSRPLVTVRGVTPAAMLVHGHIRIADGRIPISGRNEVMVGASVATQMGVSDALLATGETVLIDGREWSIVGRFIAPWTVTESEIWTTRDDLKEATKRESDSCVVVTLDPRLGDFTDIALFAATRLDLELMAMPETEYYARLSAFFAPIRAVVWVTAGLIVLGGFLGGLNTLYAAFASRVREFGALQAMGFQRTAIAINLVQESTLATVAGALIAAGVGLVALDGLAVRFSMGAFGLVVDSAVILLAIIVGVLLGLFGALPPTLRCLRLSIPEALKAV